MFTKVLVLLIVSYVVFFGMAHLSARKSIMSTSDKGTIDTFMNHSVQSDTNMVEQEQVMNVIVHANGHASQIVADLTFDGFKTIPNHTFMKVMDIQNHEIFTFDFQGSESITAFVRRCMKAATSEPMCIGFVIYARSTVDIQCIFKHYVPPARNPQLNKNSDLLTKPRMHWALEETQPQQGAVLFIKKSVYPNIVNLPKQEQPHLKPSIVQEVDAVTSGKGFVLDQPTDYDQDIPDLNSLDKYGIYNTPPTIWSTPQPTPLKCLNSTGNKNQQCPVSLKNTYATPKTDFSIGTILPKFRYTESR